ncbi:MAG TPA: response regulator transcription factor [Candidatus Paceibacterota bacterium]|nr:response regulator transcription factor [Candidatus Paceibacterota bacterium]
MKVFSIGLDKVTRDFLKTNGMAVSFEDVASPEELHDWVVDGGYEAVVVDLDATDWGIFAIRYLRNKKILTPVIGISRGKHEAPWPEQRAMFLENGGDDFIKGPANPRELVASLRAATRRNKGLVLDIAEFTHGAATVKVNLSLQSVSVNGTRVHLTGKETLLLCLLASSQNRVQSKEMLITNLYSAVEDEAEMKIIDVFVCKLRKKLADVHPDAGGVLETVWGRGYKMSSGEDDAAAVA